MNIFAFTEFVATPGYVSINRDDKGQHSISLRATGSNGDVGQAVTLNVSAETLKEMAAEIQAKTVRESIPGMCDLCGKPMPPGEEMFKYHGYSGPCPK